MVLYRVLILNPVYGYYEAPCVPCWYIEPYFDQMAQAVTRTTRLIEVIELKKDDDVRNNVWSTMKKYARNGIGGLAIVAGVGHGNVNVYTGYLLNYIYWVDMTRSGFQPELARGKIFYLLSCLTARELGPWMVNKLGAWSYLGWDEEYGFWAICPKRKEKTSKNIWTPEWYFFSPLEEAWTASMLGQLPPIGVYNYVRNKYSQYIPIVRRFYGSDVAGLLAYDNNHMKLIGHENYPPWMPKILGKPYLLPTVLMASSVVAGFTGMEVIDRLRRHKPSL